MIDTKVLSVVRGLSSSRDISVLDRIVQGLQKVLDADFTFVATVNDDKSQASTLSLFTPQGKLDNISYPLADTPCEELCDRGACIYPSAVQEHFPKDQLLAEMGVNAYIGVPLFDRQGQVFGILSALYKGKLHDPQGTESLFLLFAGLVAGEIEQQSSREKLRLLSTVVENAHEAIFILNPRREFLYVNQPFVQMSGYTLSEVEGKHANLLRSTVHDEQYMQSIWSHVARDGSWTGEIWLKRKNAELFPCRMTLNSIPDSQGKVESYVASMLDITDEKEKERQAFTQANFDRLTQLPNAYLFADRLNQALDDCRFNKKLCAVLLLDIDDFKTINDGVGLTLGDLCLVEISKRLKHILPNNSELARNRADQFAIYLHNLGSAEEAAVCAENILKSFEQPFSPDSLTLSVSCSVGISLFPDNADTAEELLYQAEQAMYTAKKQGKKCFAFYNLGIQRSIEHRVNIKRDLEQAIANKDFTLNFQPIINAQTSSLKKFEVLLRWNNHGEWISPEIFIPIAEEFGLMPRLGEIVLEKSCAALRRLYSKGHNDIVFAINRSIHEFPRKEKTTQWLNVLEKYQLPPSSICFEITESALSPDNNNLLEYLQTLRHAGCGIALDDFGTGYSSLNYVRRFPVDILKIDRSFINEITQNENDRVLVSTILAMAMSLGIEVVAEGIETPEQLGLLKNFGCHYMQGQLLSEPLPEEAIEDYLTNFHDLSPYLPHEASRPLAH